MIALLEIIVIWCVKIHWLIFRKVWRLASAIWSRVYKLTNNYLTPRDPDTFRFTKPFARIGLAGLGILLVVQMRFELAAPGFRLDAEYLFGNALAGIVKTAFYVGGALMLGSIIMFAASRNGHHREMARSLFVPLKKLGVCLGILVIYFGLMLGTGSVMQNPSQGGQGSGGGQAPGGGQIPDGVSGLLIVAPVLFLALAVPFLAFATAVLRSAPRDLFAARDGHPQLRPLVSLVLAAWTGALAATRLFQEGADPSYPVVIFFIVVLLGPIGNIVAAGFEIRWLQRKGISFRLPKSHPGGSPP